ncbi:VOC family protein [Micromonospora sp. Llam0]|uniref:VOC family protein n=1 Tax=Micromonospora sp. Llam0 TaxID=2485143 RepID=UPI00351A46B5
MALSARVRKRRPAATQILWSAIRGSVCPASWAAVAPAFRRRQGRQESAPPRCAGRHRARGDERLAALESECARLLPLGATRVQLLRADGVNESCLVMQNIEGNEFCLD